MTTSEATPSSPKELRLALVLNGGVSLAVWIGGVIHEIDRLRRGFAPDADAAAYGAALTAAGYDHVRIDVIAGASAGGINGALLAAAIQGTTRPERHGPQRLTPLEGLRDVWVQLGDIRKLTRPAREPEPPSLLHGDELIVPSVKKVLDELLVPTKSCALDHPLYLYLTATDMSAGRERTFGTSYKPIVEADHRVVFRFSAGDDDLDRGAQPPLADEELSELLPLDASQAERLARAARASSSFPGAFPPHEAKLRRGDEADTHYLIDGGVLDNQPFDPVLDRISLMEIERPVRRVVLYIVPYVTVEKVEKAEKGAETAAPKAAPGLATVIGASGLARDLPKLESLERVTQDRQDGKAARAAGEIVRERIDDAITAAKHLHDAYREVQRDELARTAKQWWIKRPDTGTGQLGGSETRHEQLLDRPDVIVDQSDPRLDRTLPAQTWEEARDAWRGWDAKTGKRWCWGFTKAERFARTALSWLGDDEPQEPAEREAWERARVAASRLAVRSREAMRRRRRAYVRTKDTQPELDPIECFVASFNAVSGDVEAVDDCVRQTVDALAQALDIDDRATVMRRLTAFEVVSNATGLRTLAPPDFDFYRVSADGRILKHDAKTPEQKLAGMQLAHFAAFLKRSWRVNDWMWGRLDAVRWIGKMLSAAPDWVETQQRAILREELVALDKAAQADENAGFSVTCDVSLWCRAHRELLDRLATGGLVDDDELDSAFKAWQLDKPPAGLREEAGSRAGVVTATGLAAVASRAFSGSASALPAPVRAIVGTTRQTTSLTYSLAVTFARAPAVGVSLVVVLAAFAVAMAQSSAGAAAWMTPALVALALVGAWTSYGWLSSPPNPWRAAVLIGLSATLIYVAVSHDTPGGWNEMGQDWLPWHWPMPPSGLEQVAWYLTEIAAAAVLVIVGLYVLGVIFDAALARWARSWLGYALLSLLAAYLFSLGVQRVGSGEEGQQRWDHWLTDHTILRLALVVAATAGVLIPLAELLSRVRRSGVQ